MRLSDGSTNVLPVGDATRSDAAWRLHDRLVRRSLARGFYQGWDMHPAQLPTRYAATYAFYRDGRAAAATGCAAYVDTASGGVAGRAGHRRRWPASCCGGWTAVPSTRPRWPAADRVGPRPARDVLARRKAAAEQ